jgi:hypothetical protein
VYREKKPGRRHFGGLRTAQGQIPAGSELVMKAFTRYRTPRVEELLQDITLGDNSFFRKLGKFHPSD